jgi:hypothetical protein
LFAADAATPIDYFHAILLMLATPLIISPYLPLMIFIRIIFDAADFFDCCHADDAIDFRHYAIADDTPPFTLLIIFLSYFRTPLFSFRITPRQLSFFYFTFHCRRDTPFLSVFLIFHCAAMICHCR